MWSYSQLKRLRLCDHLEKPVVAGDLFEFGNGDVDGTAVA